LIEMKAVALAGATSAPAMLGSPGVELAETELLWFLLPHAVSTSRQPMVRAKKREIRRIEETSEAERTVYRKPRSH
jgi:hypothetical protein